MLRQAKFERCLISLLKHYEGGLLKAWLTPELSEVLVGVERGCMILNRSVVVWNQEWMSLHYPGARRARDLRSYIVGFHQANKYPILNDSKRCYRLLSQIVRSLPTLVPVSTTTSQGFPDWWKWYVGSRSEELWLPSKTDFCASGTSSSRRCVKSITSKSWFTLTNNAGSKSRKTWKRKNSRRTSSPSSTSSLPDAMERKPGSCDVSDESKPEKKESPNSILKTRLYPTPEQKVLLKKMFGTHRTIYNKLVEVSKGDCYKLSKTELDQKYRGISQKHSLTEYLPECHLEVPEEIMNETYRDFTKAIKSSRALYNSLKENDKKTTFPSLKFKSRKDNTTSIEVRTRTLSSPATGLFRMLPTYFGFKKTEGMKVLEAIPEMNYSIRLQMTRESEFYICIPRVKAFAQTQSGRVCAIDPGVRDFITLYDPGGLTLGVTDGKDKIFQRCLSIDRLQSKLSREHRKRYRYRLKKLIYRMYQRIKCMVKDMHQKCSKWLSSNYDEVLLPKFATSEMTQKQKRISSKTSRAMLTWSHYKFKVMLADKMERTGGRMIECTEPFTSKTCSKCGRINYNINRQKTFTCPHCNHVLDRDVNAARNIYMMNEHLLAWTLRVQQSEKPTPRC